MPDGLSLAPAPPAAPQSQHAVGYSLPVPASLVDAKPSLIGEGKTPPRQAKPAGPFTLAVPSGTEVDAVTAGTLTIIRAADGASKVVLAGTDGATYTYGNITPTAQAVAAAAATPAKKVQAGDKIGTSRTGGLPFSISVPDVHGLVDATEALQSWAAGLAVNIRSLPATVAATSTQPHQQVLLVADSGARSIASTLAAKTPASGTASSIAAGSGTASALAGSLSSPLVQVHQATIDDSDILTSVVSDVHPTPSAARTAENLLSARAKDSNGSTSPKDSKAKPTTKQDPLTQLITSPAAKQLIVVVLAHATPQQANAMATRLPAGRQLLFVAPADTTAQQAAAYKAISAAHPGFRVETLPAALANKKVTPATSLAQAAATLTATYTATAYRLNSVTTEADAALSWTEQQLGKPYKWAAAGPDSFDCSGLIMDALKQAGITTPHNANGQWLQTKGNSVPLNQLKPGDLVFFAGSDGTTATPGHVGLYVGNGQLIDAPFTGAPVRFDPVSSIKGFTGATDPYGPAVSPGAGVWAAAQLGALSVPAALSQYQAFGREMSDTTWGPAEFPYLYALWERESGWNPAALNPMSGAYGIPQSLPAVKMSAAGLDWATDPYTQIMWGISYISAAYGTPQAAWAHELAYNWY